ncbi:unnamed protein product [Absidia cylindrospora]
MSDSKAARFIGEPDTFSGSLPSNWIKTLERIRKTIKMTDETLYPSESNNDELWDTMENYHQSEKQSVDGLILVLSELFSKLEITDERLHIRRFLRALHPSITYEAESKGPFKSMKTACDTARRIETLHRKYDNYEHRSSAPSSQDDVKSSMAEILDQMKTLSVNVLKANSGTKPGPNNQPQLNNDDKKVVTCFGCGAEGHYKSNWLGKENGPQL